MGAGSQSNHGWCIAVVCLPRDGAWLACVVEARRRHCRIDRCRDVTARAGPPPPTPTPTPSLTAGLLHANLTFE